MSDVQIYKKIEHALEVAQRNGLEVHCYSDGFEVKFKEGGMLGAVHTAEGLYNLLVGFEIGAYHMSRKSE